ncbi:MAG: precorrin-3B C(17)-methyltransferase [Gammaproteobacteria bacterium]|nr:precorrin-3B C(17)-methyltransferase [Gammaproteobacteria bacterium]
MADAAPAIVAITRDGAAIGRKLRDAIGGACQLHGLRGRVARADRWFDDTLAHIGALFKAGHPIVGVCASGILIRAVAPHLGDKPNEPGVLAVAPDGSCVVPLLGGHHGANELARRAGDALSAYVAITTAGEVRLGVALDEPPAGYELANRQDYKAFAGALLAGEPVRISGHAPWLEQLQAPRSKDAVHSISVTHRRDGVQSSRSLVYHPRSIAVGVGCERGADEDEVVALVIRCLAQADVAPASVAGVYSIDRKADEPAVHAVAAALDRPARFFTAPALEALRPRLANPSAVVFRATGCHGVAEGAALAAAGETGGLLLPKTRSARATCAIALGKAPIAADIGTSRGILYVVGIGPGRGGLRVPEADGAIRRAKHVLGYSLYLDLVADLLHSQTVHRYGLGEETQRVRAALALAAKGERTALVCSGDAGIYAMAALVYEQLDRAADPAWRRVDVQVIPGVSALQAAAALAGAPIGHDFCAISLSDLLTPWADIEKRLHAAGAGDFVIALYNPASRQRRQQFEQAVAIIRQYRRPETAIVIGKQLGRPRESVAVIALDELSATRVDMVSVVLIGSSTTATLSLGGALRVYTPRGYGGRYARTDRA